MFLKLRQEVKEEWGMLDLSHLPIELQEKQQMDLKEKNYRLSWN